jgi:cell division protein YceG involved in septum cleavage
MSLHSPSPGFEGSIMTNTYKYRRQNEMEAIEKILYEDDRYVRFDKRW